MLTANSSIVILYGKTSQYMLPCKKTDIFLFLILAGNICLLYDDDYDDDNNVAFITGEVIAEHLMNAYTT